MRKTLHERPQRWSSRADRRYVGTQRPSGLWRLCAYGARGALALSRLSELPDGRFCYDMKRALPDGRKHLVMTGVELLKKLIPLVPLTWANLTRFCGVFAPPLLLASSSATPMSTPSSPPTATPDERPRALENPGDPGSIDAGAAAGE